MANAIAYSSLDMFASGTAWQGTATAATSSYIRLESYPHRQDFNGSFTYDQVGLTGGTITSSYAYEAGVQSWSVTGISLNVLTYNSYITSNNIQGLYSYVFGNNDSFTGSSGNDSLRTFTGNDIISAGDGNDLLEGGIGTDTLNGGTGTDTAIFSGTRAQYTLSGSGTGWTLSGPDGVDTLTGIEFAQFSDQTLSLGNFAPTGAISISGTASQNQTLSAGSTLADLNGLGTITWQWKADGIAISGATASIFTLTEAQVGKAITLTARYTDGHGTAESVTSAATGVVANINDTPTGTLGVSGMATQGQILTASNTLADPDGLGAISYQWQAAGSAIIGATASTFTLTEAQVGKIITVTANYTDGHGTAESVTSTATGGVANINDAPIGTVDAGGTATQGQTLTASNTLADPDGVGVVGYQWQSSSDGTSWSNLSTGATLGLTEAQVGKQIKVIASYTDGHGTAESAISIPTGTVANINDTPSGTVGVSGTATQGQLLTASNTLADIDGLSAISYQWNANGTSISGATGSTLLLTQAQVGKTITVSASYTDGHGTAESVTSTATGAVANINDAPVVGNSGYRTAGLNEALSLKLGMLFSDPDGDALTFGITGLPAGLSMDTATGIITGTTPGATGLHHLTVTGTDPSAAFASLNFDLDVIVGNTVSANVVTRSGIALPGVTAHELISTTPAGSLYAFSNMAVSANAGTGLKTLTADLIATGSSSDGALDLTFHATGGGSFQSFDLTGPINAANAWSIVTDTSVANTYVIGAINIGATISADTLMGKLTLGLPTTATGGNVLDLTGATLGEQNSPNRSLAFSQADMGSSGQLNTTLPDSNLAISLSRGTADYLVNGTTKPVTAADALDALKLSVGLAASRGSTWKELIAADMNHDGRVTAADALEILKTSVGINTIQPGWVFVPNDAPGLAGMTKAAVTYKDDWNLSSISAPTANTFTGILVGDVNNSWVIPA